MSHFFPQEIITVNKSRAAWQVWDACSENRRVVKLIGTCHVFDLSLAAVSVSVDIRKNFQQLILWLQLRSASHDEPCNAQLSAPVLQTSQRQMDDHHKVSTNNLLGLL